MESQVFEKTNLGRNYSNIILQSMREILTFLFSFHAYREIRHDRYQFDIMET